MAAAEGVTRKSCNQCSVPCRFRWLLVLLALRQCGGDHQHDTVDLSLSVLDTHADAAAWSGLVLRVQGCDGTELANTTFPVNVSMSSTLRLPAAPAETGMRLFVDLGLQPRPEPRPEPRPVQVQWRLDFDDATPWLQGSTTTTFDNCSCSGGNYKLEMEDDSGDGWNGTLLLMVDCAGRQLTGPLALDKGRNGSATVCSDSIPDAAELCVRVLRGTQATGVGWTLNSPDGVPFLSDPARPGAAFYYRGAGCPLRTCPNETDYRVVLDMVASDGDGWNSAFLTVLPCSSGDPREHDDEGEDEDDDEGGDVEQLMGPITMWQGFRQSRGTCIPRRLIDSGFRVEVSSGNHDSEVSWALRSSFAQIEGGAPFSGEHCLTPSFGDDDPDGAKSRSFRKVVVIAGTSLLLMCLGSLWCCCSGPWARVRDNTSEEGSLPRMNASGPGFRRRPFWEAEDHFLREGTPRLDDTEWEAFTKSIPVIPFTSTGLFAARQVKQGVLEEPGGEDELTCTICLEPVVTSDLVKELDCTHVYHAACLDHWLRFSDKCPQCRSTATATSDSSSDTATSVGQPLGPSTDAHAHTVNIDPTEEEAVVADEDGPFSDAL
mmetsp:Transcript_8662/g.24652  ORF Transcript_8662/g.24652 Transcript_8662/m.24652 type:complete len:601 (-) Transcript_8662:123-1925(-)